MSSYKVHAICLIIITTGIVLAKEYTNTQQSPVLNPGERYQDMFPLTLDNYTEKLLRNRDPWIVIFHDGTVEKEWKTMATHLRGLCWIGLIDVTTAANLLNEMEYSKGEVARVYPHGNRLTKDRKWTTVGSQNEARSLAIASLPDKTQTITGADIQDLIMDCFMAKPSRFPAYIISDEKETSIYLKALAIRFKKYFTFGKVVKPTANDLKQLGLGEAYVAPPALFVLVTPDGNLDKMNAIKYDSDALGSMNYTNVMQFLFAVNSQFRHTLPGDNLSNQQQEAEMSDIIKLEEARFDITVPGNNRSSSKTTESNKELNDGIDFKVTSQSNIGSKDEL